MGVGVGVGAGKAGRRRHGPNRGALVAQVLAAASGIITALRMRGAMDTARFVVRVARLMLWPPSGLATA